MCTFYGKKTKNRRTRKTSELFQHNLKLHSDSNYALKTHEKKRITRLGELNFRF